MIGVFVAGAVARPADGAAFTVPPLTGAVVDAAAMMEPGTRQELDAALRRLWREGGSQLVVLTVDDLGGLPIEQASIKVTDAWKLGTKKGDNGILLLVSKREHGLRIEVGQGHEGTLTDAYAHRIIADVMIPRFRAGDPTGGIIAGVEAVLHVTDPDRPLGLAAPARAAAGQDSPSSPQVPGWVILLVLLLIIIAHRAARGSRSYGARAGFFGGWGGGGGGGGGGFSGGGGGFSGGGASGQW